MDDSDPVSHPDPAPPTAFGGAVGAGVVLVLLPSLALYCGTEALEQRPSVGLPLMAIFGVMILFGALALVSTLFARLKLADRTQALALPEGSIRAAIALALIVLFAIIAIMLFQSGFSTYQLPGLSGAQVEALRKDQVHVVLAVVQEKCGAPSDCNDASFTVHLARKPLPESSDMAKQLLILIGTLMTSVTSFYFGSRSAAAAAAEPPVPVAVVARSTAPSSAEDGDVSTLQVTTSQATADTALPPATGGVAP